MTLRRWLRRLLWSALAVVIVLAAGFFGGGGWYFASQIRSGALKVEPAGPMRAYDDVRVVYRASQRSLPVFGPGVPAPLVWTAEQIAAIRFGVDWAATNYLGNTAWLTVPALVTHGSADTTVPVSVSARLKEAKPALVTFAVFPGAGHVELWNINGARYTPLLESFLSPAAP